MAELLKIGFSQLPDTTITLINNIGGIVIVPGQTAVNLVVSYPNLFWIEPDIAGIDRLCTIGILDKAFPTLTYGVTTIGSKPFELCEVIGKTESNRGWHPTTRPPRP